MTKAFFCLYILCLSFVSWALPPESLLDYQGNLFSHFVSHDLKTPNALIEKVIISVHGSERNAHSYFNSIEAMVKRQRGIDKTIIISPHFKEALDPLLPQELYYSAEGWLSGDEALNGPVSSFEVIDYIMSLLANKSNFPNLKEIVMTGHSAGGQLTQRYAVGSNSDRIYPDIRFRYIVANPGSYVYLTKNRPVNLALNCHFNDYKFGLDHLNRYMQKDVSQLIDQYTSKQVVYLLGEQDIISNNIDQSCPAQYQGKTRLERGQFYKAQLETEFPLARHFLFTVPGIGHTQYGMYTSAVGQKVLFQEL